MLSALREFAHLNAPSASTYRALMRLFYEAHLKQQHTLLPDEVLAGIEDLELDLTPEALLLDLDALVPGATWGGGAAPGGWVRWLGTPASAICLSPALSGAATYQLIRVATAQGSSVGSLCFVWDGQAAQEGRKCGLAD